ncbi:MAG: thioredoxin family protein [Bacteroidia bacterium]|nr:thioredoxin family protein [Bacteroidia bacterium]
MNKIKTAGLLSVALLSLLFVTLKSDTQRVEEAGIHFAHLKFKEARDKAKAENKLVFIDAYTTWCGPCKLMARTVFKDPEVGKYYNGHFVNLKMDMETSEGIFLAKKYGVTAYPTYLFIKPDGTLVKKSMGAVKSDKFIGFAKSAISAAK